jgi:hypothetical protein
VTAKGDRNVQSAGAAICDTAERLRARKDSRKALAPRRKSYVPITSLAQLSDRLRALAVGQRSALPYSVYALLFPPGEPDDDARVAAFGFAREHGCVLEHQPRAQQVLFIKKSTSLPALRN